MAFLGSDITLEAEYEDAGGALLPVVEATLSIKNSAGETIIETGVEPSPLGHFIYTWTPSITTPIGDYTATWTASLNGDPLPTGTEVITLSYSPEDLEQERTLRMLMREQGADTKFTSIDIMSILLLSHGIMDRAAAIGWSLKAGDYVELIDTEESGAVRHFNQLFSHAERMFRIYDKRAIVFEEEQISSGGVPPQSVKIWEEERLPEVSLFAEGKMDSVYIRAFPLHRFPAVLG